MEKKQSKISRVKGYLKVKGSITYYEAEKIGVPRLSSIIWVLEKKGWKFDRIKVNVTNDFGDTNPSTRYILNSEPEEK